MDRAHIYRQIKAKQSFLCIGLDTDLEKIPSVLQNETDPVFSFNKAIIDATAPYCVAYKPNTAFYEASGTSGWASLEKTIAYIKKQYPDQFVIADAKRADIGNTSAAYARAFFTHLKADALTVSPYMGQDSVQAFLGFPGKWVVLLALTSNSGANDFQRITTPAGRLFETVIRQAKGWATADEMMFVVGATQSGSLAQIRKLIPDHFLLIPGVGAQGGSLADVAQHGMNATCGLLINASRSIIYASAESDFARAAATKAESMQKEMAAILHQKSLC